MKHLKKFFALLLVVIMTTSFATSAMATEGEDSGIPENAVCHTIELVVSPGETVEVEDDGITPFIWNQEHHTVSGNKTYTQQFNVPERYFAFEMKATDTNGNAINGSYRVDLLLALPFASIASAAKAVDGITYKLDHIDLLSSNQTCLFCITNAAGTPISVTLTYYSWA